MTALSAQKEAPGDEVDKETAAQARKKADKLAYFLGPGGYDDEILLEALRDLQQKWLRPGPVADLSAGKETPADKIDKQTVSQTLKKAHQVALFQGSFVDEILLEALRDLLRKTLRPIFSHFQIVSAGDGSAPLEFQRITLNKLGQGFDGIRFKTPPGERNCDLDWEFVYSRGGSLLGWFIVPKEGTLEGFTTLESFDRPRIPGLDTPSKYRLIVQPLHGGRLQPGKEYLIWFAFRNERPADILVRLELTPAK